MSYVRKNVAGQISAIASLFEATDPHIAKILKDQRKQGLKELRAGTHSQQWRAQSITGARKKVTGSGNLGPMGAKGDDAIFYLKETQVLKELIQDGYISKSELLRIIRNDIYLPIQKTLTAHIWTWVPSDSSATRKAMTKALTNAGGSITNDIPFLIQLNTRGIEYAKPLMNMPLHYIKHGGAGDVHALLGRRTTSRKTGLKLSDPKVRENSYRDVLFVGRKLADKKWRQTRKKIFKMFKQGPLGLLLGGRQINTLMSKAFIPVFNNKF